MEHAIHEDTDALTNNETIFSGGHGKEEVALYYNKWANRYEKDLNSDRYTGPRIAAEFCAKCFDDNERSQTRVLDVAAGTGTVGVELVKRGFVNVDALDPSKGMLEEAKKKNVYSNFLCEFLSSQEELPVANGTYDCVTSSGGFGNGHIPSDSVLEILRITKSGGYVVIVMREEYLTNVPEYKDTLEPLFQKLEKQGKWKSVERVIVPNYAFKKTGVVFVFKCV